MLPARGAAMDIFELAAIVTNSCPRTMMARLFAPVTIASPEFSAMPRATVRAVPFAFSTDTVPDDSESAHCGAPAIAVGAQQSMINAAIAVMCRTNPFITLILIDPI